MELLPHLLKARGIKTSAEAEIFLNPNYERDLHDPFLMLDMAKAVERVNKALAKKEKIVIFGDYDADGVPGTAVLALFFKKIGHTNFDIYIPDRHEESYGLSVESIAQIAAEGATLIITVDCGITDVAEVAAANKLGIDVIITDHHLPPEVLPAAYAIVNNKQANDTYPFKFLCGAGTAFKLVQALIKTKPDLVPPGWEKWLLDLVGISTVSDMVPLVGENRALAYYGLKVLRQSPRLGLNALFASARLKRNFINEDDIGFTIGPRINSASRMSHASEAYKLLITDDEVEATTIAKHLEDKNKERKKIVEVITKAVDAKFADAEPPALIVVGDAKWSLGVLGLAASRIVEKFARPVFVWSQNSKGEVKGSCRSDGSINVVELMRAANKDNFFIDIGGHEMAGGFSLTADKLPGLEDKLIKAHKKLAKTVVDVTHRVDAELGLDEVTVENFNLINKLAPFGIDNPKPQFKFRGVEVSNIKEFGNGGIHLELGFTNSLGRGVKAIGFFYKLPAAIKAGDLVDMIATLEMSYFGYRPELRLRIVDLEKAG